MVVSGTKSTGSKAKSKSKATKAKASKAKKTTKKAKKVSVSKPAAKKTDVKAGAKKVVKDREVKNAADEIAENAAQKEAEVQQAMEDHELFSTDELLVFRSALESEKRKILQKAKDAVASGQIQIDTNEMMDDVDLASATIDQNLTFRLLDRDRKLLSGIERAIEKIETGEYGYCEGTGDPIPKRRLELRPWCRYSVKYKEQLERAKKSGRGVADDDDEF